jgi:hypothetical protein
LLTFYCPNCWERISDKTATCPKCGYELSKFNHQSYEEKLILALHHPIPGRRNIAAQILGNNNSLKAVEEFEKILQSGEKDYFFLKVVLLAVAKINSPKRMELLKLAARYPNAMVCELANTLIKKVQENKPIDEWDRGTG